MKRKTLSLLIALAAVVAAQAREKININLGWKFIREAIEGAQAPEYNDAKWQTVDLPHDAAVHHEFQKKGDGASCRSGADGTAATLPTTRLGRASASS